MGAVRHRWLGAFYKIPANKNMKNNTNSKFFSIKVIASSLFFVMVFGCGFFINNAHAADGVLGVTQISAVQTYASADGSYADGWKWVFNVTVPTSKTVLQMKLADWTGSVGNIPAANNLQFYSSQSTNAADEAHAISIATAGTYGTQMYLDPSGDCDANTPGNQIQIALEARVPVGSTGGSYSTSYGINVNPDNNPISFGDSQPIITNVQSISITSNTAVITWTTDKYSDSKVYFGTTSGIYALSVGNSGTVSSNGSYTHSVSLSGLNASTTYYYKVASTDNDGSRGVSDEYSFTTQTAPTGSVIVSSADTQIIYPDAINQKIGSYVLTASSVEGVSVSDVSIQTNGIDLQNLKVMVGGGQFGVTQAVASSGIIYTFSGLSFAIPAGGTVNVDLYADNATSTAGPATTLTDLLGTGMISHSPISLANPVQGSVLSFAAPLLTVTKNAAFGNQTVTMNSANAEIGSFSFTASSASGVQVNTVSVQAYPNGTQGRTADIQNLKLMIGGAQFGTTQGVVADQGTYTFSGSPFTVPAGGTKYVNIYADVLSSATSSTPNPATALVGCSGTGVVSYNAISCVGSIPGQDLGVAGGTTVSVGLDSSSPAASQFVMGSTGNVLAAYRFAETQNIENVKITDLTVIQNTAAAKAGFQNVALYSGATLLGTAGSAATSATGFAYAFHFGTPIIIPQSNSVTVTLRGDVASFASQGAMDNSTSTFTVATSTVTALGASSNMVTAVTGGATGNTMTVLRTVLTPSATALGTASGRVKSSVDNLATITFTANSAGSAMLKTLKLTFNGNAIGATTNAATFILRDANNNDITVTDGATTTGSSCAGTSPCTVTWTFSTASTPFVISGGTSYTFTLQSNDTDLVAASGSNSVSLGITVQDPGDVTYYDNGDGSGSTINLSLTLVPINVNAVTFAAGS